MFCTLGLILCCCLSPADVCAQHYYKAGEIVTPGSSARGVFAISGSVSYLTRLLNESEKNGGYSIHARGGFRIGNGGGFLELSYVGWEGYHNENKADQSSLNFGIGGEILYFEQRMRSALSVGMTVLYTEAPPDPPGTIGFYVELVPTGFVIQPHKNVGVNWTPISLYVGVETIKGIPLVVIQYRTTIALEFSL